MLCSTDNTSDYNFRLKIMFGCLCLQLFVGGYMPPVVCRRVHVLFTMFGSSLPPVVCRGVHVLFTMFVSSLPPVVCRRVHVLFTMFVSSLPPVVCRRVHVLFTCLFAHSVVQHILCCGFVFFFFLLCTLCSKFLWIFHF